jgi:hypothetical protein
VPDHGDQVTHHARQGAGRTLSHLGGDLVDGISMLAVSGVQSVGQREVDGDGIERDASDRGERGADPPPARIAARSGVRGHWPGPRWVATMSPAMAWQSAALSRIRAAGADGGAAGRASSAPGGDDG